MNHSWKLFWKFSVFALVIIGIAWVLYQRERLDIDLLKNWIDQQGNAGPLLFILLYIIGTVFFLPGSILTLLGGALFGPVAGTFYNLTGATIGAILAFLIARYLAYDWVEKKTGGRLKQLLLGVQDEGWRFVAFTRLVPLLPFNLLNYALGLTAIRFLHYVIATYIFMLPGALAYTYLGYIGKEAATGGDNLIQKVMIAVTLLGIVAFLPRLVSSYRRGGMLAIEQLKQKLEEDEELLVLDVRTEEDYFGEQGHIAGSRLIPLEQLEQRLGEISEYYEKNIVTICRTDKKSAKAARLLSAEGFANVQVARMGMTDWLKHDYPVVKDKS